MRGPFKRLLGRRSSPPAYIESRLERLSQYPPMPPPPPPATPQAAAAMQIDGAPTGLMTPSRVKLILADGSESALPTDPELTARADYLVKSMLPPRPPAPDEGSSGPRPI